VKKQGQFLHNRFDGIPEGMRHAHRGRIILIRHGETEANRRRCFADSDDVPLTDTGRLQSEELARRLFREFRPEVLVSSEFLRARQTSEIIGTVLGLATETIPGIYERDFGCLRGHPYERLGEMMALNNPDAGKPWVWSPAGGESLDNVRQRAIASIEKLRDRFPGREIAIVSHGAVIRAVRAHITGEWSEASVPPNCGIVTVEYDAYGWKHPTCAADWDLIVPDEPRPPSPP
jgi:broad specificity phosphatase PhoE